MIDLTELRNRLNYDAETGIFTWKDAGFNKKQHIGKTTGFLTKEGYIKINFNRAAYFAHRIAWFYIHGIWPTEIDHIDRNKTNNKISNLREVTRYQNHSNKKNNLNMVGTHFHKMAQKWIAQISYKGKRLHIGSYKTQEEAYAAYLINLERVEKGLTPIKVNP